MVYKEYLKDRRRKNQLMFSLFILILIILFLLDIFLGSVNIKPIDVLRVMAGRDSDYRVIIMDFRIPKAITAVVTGIALSISGLQMQTIFRNPMAGPYVLGISSGASLGVALIILGSSFVVPGTVPSNWLLVFAAWAGAAAVLLLVLMIAAKIRDIMIILILGIMLAGGISSIVTILQYFSSETMLRTFVLWTMGSLGNLSSDQLNVLMISVMAGVILSFASIKTLNALLLGENYASSLGLNLNIARVLVFITTSILAGSVTAFCGPIGFIGIAVPHLARIFFGTSDHKILIPGVIFAGSCIMLACDIISQLPGSERILPINAVTSFIGIPVVIWVILRNRKFSGI